MICMECNEPTGSEDMICPDCLQEISGYSDEDFDNAEILKAIGNYDYETE
jgi:predicted amidophosphoribosyltransferase